MRIEVVGLIWCGGLHDHSGRGDRTREGYMRRRQIWWRHQCCLFQGDLRCWFRSCQLSHWWRWCRWYRRIWSGDAQCWGG